MLMKMDLVNASGEKIVGDVKQNTGPPIYSLMIFRKPWTTFSFSEEPHIFNIVGYQLFSVERQRKHVEESLKRDLYLEKSFHTTMDYLAWLWTDLNDGRLYSLASWNFEKIKSKKINQLLGVYYFRTTINDNTETFLLDIGSKETIFYSRSLNMDKVHRKAYARDQWLTLGRDTLMILFADKLGFGIILTDLSVARIF